MSWGEMMVIGAIALIVIGPKDLPKALRTVGSMVGKVRRMAGEFQSQFNEALREAELDDVRRQFEGLNQTVAPLNQGFDPVGTVRDEVKKAIESPAASEARREDRPALEQAQSDPLPGGGGTAASPDGSAGPPAEPQVSPAREPTAVGSPAAKPVERAE